MTESRGVWPAFRASWALFVGMALLMTANGLLVTLLSVRGAALGFSQTAIGLMQSAYPLGALAGCLLAPRLVADVGHVRSFAAFASLASAAALGHLVTADPASWAAMRLVAGFCFSGLYVIAESWLNGRASNTNRGAILSIYFVIQIGGAAAGPLLLGLPSDDGVLFFVIVSALVSLAVIPMLITADAAPRFETPERMPLGRLWRVSPVAPAAALANGVAQGAIYVGLALYANAIGFAESAVGALIAAATFGGMLGQAPLARLSDLIDRRLVLLGAAGATLPAAALLAGLGAAPPAWAVFGGFALIGALTMPIYSICAAHMNDWLEPSQIVAASGTLVLVFYVGIAIGPTASAAALEAFGPPGLLSLLLAGNGATALVAAVRLVRGRARRDETGAAAPVSAHATPMAARLNPEASRKRRGG